VTRLQVTAIVAAILTVGRDGLLTTAVALLAALCLVVDMLPDRDPQ
jgi:hypothetical protein